MDLPVGETTLKTNISDIYLPSVKLEDVERIWIMKAYEHHKKNVTVTAKSLGIARATLYRKLGKMNVF